MGDWVAGIGGGRYEDEGGEWASVGKKKRQNKRQSTASRVKTAAEAIPVVDEKENPGSRHIDPDIPQSQESTVFKKKMFDDGARRQRLVSKAADKPPAEDRAYLLKVLSRYNRGEKGRLDVLKVLVSLMKKNPPAHAIHLFNEVKNSKVQQNTITYNAAISACEKGGQTDQALHLLQGAISDGIFKADPVRQGLLDLHCKAVLTEDAYACFLTSRLEALAHDPGVPLPVAKTMLQRHIDILTPGAVIAVGCNGDDILRDGVMEFLSAHGIKAQPDTHNAGRIVVIQEAPPLV